MIELFLVGVIVFTFAIFGASWLVSQSVIFGVVRSPINRLALATSTIPVVGRVTQGLNHLINCIVCTSVWLSACFFFVKDTSQFLSLALPPATSVLDYVLWVSYAAGTTWIISIYTDDAS